jgi:hypothetical protein
MQKYADDELGRAAGRVWALGRANPIDFEVRTPLGTFTTDDRSTCHSQPAAWTCSEGPRLRSRAVLRPR